MWHPKTSLASWTARKTYMSCCHLIVSFWHLKSTNRLLPSFLLTIDAQHISWKRYYRKRRRKVYIYAFVIIVGTADRKSNHDPSSEIQRTGSQADLGTCPECWRTCMLFFNFRRRQTSRPLLFMGNNGNTQKRRMSKTTQRCQKQERKEEGWRQRRAY